MLNNQQFLTFAEVASCLSVSIDTVKRLVRTGKMPQPMRITPRCVRFERDAIQAFIQSQNKKPA